MFGIPYACSHTMKEQRNTSSKRYSNQKHRNRQDIVGTKDNGQILLTFTFFIEYIYKYMQNYHFCLLNTAVFCLGTFHLLIMLFIYAHKKLSKDVKFS